MTNHTIKAKNKKTSEIVEFRKVYGMDSTQKGFVLVGNQEITLQEFNDLFEVVEDNEDWVIGIPHCESIPQTDTLKKEDWEDNFDKEFVMEITRYDDNSIIPENDRTKCFLPDIRPKHIKHFITQEIAKAKEEERGRIIRGIEQLYWLNSSSLNEITSIIQNNNETS